MTTESSRANSFNRDADEMDYTDDRYGEVFDIEIDGWCHGISKYPGEVSSILVFSVIKELSPSFRKALKSGVVFSVIDIANKLSRAAKYLVDEQDIVFRILSLFPDPTSLPEDMQYVVAQVLDTVEEAYPGAIGELEEKWASERDDLFTGVL